MSDTFADIQSCFIAYLNAKRQLQSIQQLALEHAARQPAPAPVANQSDLARALFEVERWVRDRDDLTGQEHTAYSALCQAGVGLHRLLVHGWRYRVAVEGVVYELSDVGSEIKLERIAMAVTSGADER